MSSPAVGKTGKSVATDSSLPAVPLGEVVMPVERAEVPTPGVIYRQLGVRLWGQGAYEREPLEGSQTKYSTLSRVEADDIVVNKIWARNGSVAVVSAELSGCYVSAEFPSFIPIREKLLPRWFHWLTKTPPFWEQCDEKSQGTSGKNRIRPEQFLKVQIPLPPLEEQRRIVARIDDLAGKIEEAQGLRREVVDETNLLMTKAMKGAFAEYLPLAVPIGDVFKVTTGSTPSRSNPAFWEGDIRWVSSGEVAFFRITDTNEKITDLGLVSTSAKIYPPGTVLLAMIGQGKTRGQCAILDCYATTNQNVAGIHVYETPHLPAYVYWWLRSQYFESRFAETGTAQPALSGERVRLISIPLAPAEEQRRIVAYLDDLQSKADSLKMLQAETAAELDALLPSILDKAFKGEL